MIDNSVKLTENLEIRHSCLVHDLGKGITPNEMLPHHYGHDEKGIKLVGDLSNRICIPNSWTKCGKVACKWHMKAGIFEQMTPKKKIELIEKVSASMLGLEGLKIVVACDKAREGEDLIEKLDKITFEKLGKECLEKINGEFIKQKYTNIEGKQFSERLHEERVKWLKSIDKK